jgi:hypothetical protein
MAQHKDWNAEMLLSWLKMLEKGHFYGTLQFTFINGNVSSAQLGQNIKFPATEKPIIISKDGGESGGR